MRSLLWTVMLLMIATGAWAQVPSDRMELLKLPVDAQSVVTTWLHQDCGIDELHGLQDRLQQLSLPLEPVFWEAYRLGPTEVERKTFLEETRHRYQERQSHLEKFGERLFGSEEATQLQSTSEEQYVQRRVDDYVNRYRTAALAGLGVVGTKTSPLEPIAGDDQNPAQEAAKEALQSIERRMRH